jgi:hypothetical protein
MLLKLFFSDHTFDCVNAVVHDQFAPDVTVGPGHAAGAVDQNSVERHAQTAADRCQHIDVGSRRADGIRIDAEVVQRFLEQSRSSCPSR